jgi:hypothetical protein
VAASLEIHSIAGAIVNPKLAHVFTHRLGIAGVAESQAVEPRGNGRGRPLIPELAEPLAESFSLLRRYHVEV